MEDERLYINNRLVDIDTDTKITLSVKSNLFRDVSKIVSNSTYTVKLPKTVHNQAVLGHVDLVQSRDRFPYLMHEVRYFRNGVEVIKDGRATVLQVSEDAIEIAIVWGLYSKFSTILNEGKSLNQLKSNARIMYNDRNELDNYADALTKDYFYAGYDVWVRNDEKDYSWRTSQGMKEPFETKPIVRDGSIFGGSRNQSNGYSYLHPVVSAAWLLDLIYQNTGIKFVFPEDAKKYIKSLIIPLISKKANELTYVDAFSADLRTMSDVGDVTFTVTEKNSTFTGEIGEEITEIRAKADADTLLDLSAEWSFEIEDGAIPNQRRMDVINGKEVLVDVYFLSAWRWLRMTVKTGLQEKEYLIGDNKPTVVVPAGYTGVCRYKYEAYGKIEVKQNTTIKIEWQKNGHLYNPEFHGGTVRITSLKGETVPSGGYFPIAENLPKIKIIDYVKFLAAITGTFPLQINEEDVVRFVPLSEIWENRRKAKDWTKKIVPAGAENKPQSLEFMMSEYGQHNLYKWKQDDKVRGKYDGDIEIPNDALEKEKVLFEFPFAASDGNNVPMYTKPESKKPDGEFGGGHEQGEAKLPSYSACKDRILRLTKDEKGKAQAVFDINMQEIIESKYDRIVGSLRRMKLIKEKVRMRDIEVVGFDETTPVYLAQYGDYFAVLEIKSSENGIAEATMLQLNEN